MLMLSTKMYHFYKKSRFYLVFLSSDLPVLLQCLAMGIRHLFLRISEKLIRCCDFCIEAFFYCFVSWQLFKFVQLIGSIIC